MGHYPTALTYPWRHTEVIMEALFYNSSSPLRHVSFFKMHRFFVEAQRQLEDNPRTLLRRLDRVRRDLVRVDASEVFVAGNVKDLTDTHGREATNVHTVQ